MTQVARLFLRGSMKDTIKNMTTEQKQEIESIIEMVMGDPNLESAKTQFCNALRVTIAHEYAHRDVSLVDYQFALFRAAVAAKFGWGNNEPKQSVLEDPIQRKKWFQFWVFQYLRQILRENKRPGYSESKDLLLPADLAAVCDIEEVLHQTAKNGDYRDKRLVKDIMEVLDIDHRGSNTYLKVDVWKLPLSTLNRLHEVREEYLTHKIRIVYRSEEIVIEPLDADLPWISAKKRREVRVRFSSFEASRNDDDDASVHHLEFRVSEDRQKNMLNEVDDIAASDMIKILDSTLPDDAREVLYLIIDPPESFLEITKGKKLCKGHLAKYLKVNNKEVTRLMHVIKHHAMANGMMFR